MLSLLELERIHMFKCWRNYVCQNAETYILLKWVCRAYPDFFTDPCELLNEQGNAVWLNIGIAMLTPTNVILIVYGQRQCI